ncbi:hypothetical protein, partial [Halogeometricum luteum]
QMSVSTTRYVAGKLLRVSAVLVFAFFALGMILWTVVLGPTAAGVTITSLSIALSAWAIAVALVGKHVMYPSETEAE